MASDRRLLHYLESGLTRSCTACKSGPSQGLCNAGSSQALNDRAPLRMEDGAATPGRKVVRVLDSCTMTPLLLRVVKVADELLGDRPD